MKEFRDKRLTFVGGTAPVSAEEQRAAWDKQLGCCANRGCRVPLNTSTAYARDSPRLDHDVITGKFRGWLCQSCNTLVGYAYHERRVLLGAADYIYETRARSTRDFMALPWEQRKHLNGGGAGGSNGGDGRARARLREEALVEGQSGIAPQSYLFSPRSARR